MERIIKIILILAVVTTIGYVLGVGTNTSEVRVKDAQGNVQVIKPAATSELAALNPGYVSQLPWFISRSSALAAYILLFAIVIWGMGMTVGWTYKIFDPARAWQLHQDMSLSFAVLVVVHAFSLLFDHFINFTILDILIPFFSKFNTIFLSLGIIGFYLLVAIVVISVFLRLKMPRLWRLNHYSTFLLFIFATLHGFNMGTDSSTMIMKIVYPVAAIVFLLVATYRFIIYPLSVKKKIG
ncbi:MAG: hypothetical protein WCK11_00440 [Candidatus Falkowbacteria bacterium]